jgi:hypothetical protein
MPVYLSHLSTLFLSHLYLFSVSHLSSTSLPHLNGSGMVKRPKRGKRGWRWEAGFGWWCWIVGSRLGVSVGKPLVARDFLMSSRVGVSCDVRKYEREKWSCSPP